MPQTLSVAQCEALSEFQISVYNALLVIPRGQVSTYRWLAKYIHCASAQAIGQALKRNPYAPEVPCHRIIKTDLTIGGFAGHTEGKEITRKRRLLKDEGVDFIDGRLNDTIEIFTYGLPS